MLCLKLSGGIILMNNRIEMEDFNQNDLKIEVKDGNNGKLNIFFIGRIYMLNPSEIVGPYLEKLHKHMVDKGIKQVSVNFAGLHLLNSSGLKTIIRWFKLNEKLNDDKKYYIDLYYDEKVDWQETSLAMLTELFPEIINKKAI